jgi:hypothetical protein
MMAETMNKAPTEVKEQISLLQASMTISKEYIYTFMGWKNDKDGALDFAAGLRTINNLRDSLIKALDKKDDSAKTARIATGLFMAHQNYQKMVGRYCSGPEKYITDYDLSGEIMHSQGPRYSEEYDMLQKLLAPLPQSTDANIKAIADSLASILRQSTDRDIVVKDGDYFEGFVYPLLTGVYGLEMLPKGKSKKEYFWITNGNMKFQDGGKFINVGINATKNDSDVYSIAVNTIALPYKRNDHRGSHVLVNDHWLPIWDEIRDAVNKTITANLDKKIEFAEAYTSHPSD